LVGLPLVEVTATALWHARCRLGVRPVRALFDLLRGPACVVRTTGARWKGLLIVAIDGTHLDGYPSDADVRTTKTEHDWVKGLPTTTECVRPPWRRWRGRRGGLDAGAKDAVRAALFERDLEAPC
jgi:hypothetical protein